MKFKMSLLSNLEMKHWVLSKCWEIGTSTCCWTLPLTLNRKVNEIQRKEAGLERRLRGCHVFFVLPRRVAPSRQRLTLGSREYRPVGNCLWREVRQGFLPSNKGNHFEQDPLIGHQHYFVILIIKSIDLHFLVRRLLE